MFDKSLLKKISFNLNYKWVKGFEFEGSPQVVEASYDIASMGQKST